jgi:hypothetical protein
VDAGNVRFDGQVLASTAGSATACAYAVGTLNKGIFGVTDGLAFSVDSTEVCRLALGVGNYGLQMNAGSAGDPAYTFVDDPTSGFYYIASTNLGLALGGVLNHNFGVAKHVYTPAAASSGNTTHYTLTAAAHTAQTAGADVIDVNFNLARTVQHATGAVALQRAFIIQAPTYSFVGASTMSLAFTFEITGAPAAGANATLTAKAGARIIGGLVLGSAALATGATTGFLYIPSCAGTPTGVPEVQAGTVAMIYDTTNDKLYIYRGGWKGGTVPGVWI